MNLRILIESLERRSLLSVFDPTFGQGGVLAIASAPSGSFSDPDGIQTTSEIQAFVPLSDGSFAYVESVTSHDNASDETTYSQDFSRSDSEGSTDAYNLPAQMQDGVLGGKLLSAGNGKVILAEVFENKLTLARFDAGSEGSVDPSFGNNGIATATLPLNVDYGMAWTIAEDSAGRLVFAAAVNSADAGTCQAEVARFNANGTLDTSFSGNGISTGAAFTGSADLLRVQSDDRIVAAGEDYNGVAESTDIFVARLDPGGSLDTTFSGDGIHRFAADVVLPADQTITVQSDGKVLVAYTQNVSIEDEDTVGELTRLTADGQVDSTFGDHGTLSFGSQTLDAVLVAPTSGKITALGGGLALRLNANGSTDTSFNGTGSATVPLFSNDHNTPAAYQLSDTAIVVLFSGYQVARLAPRPAFAVTDTAIVITAGSGDDTITFDETLANNAFSATLNYDGQITNYDHGFRTLDIDAGDGNNSITFPAFVSAIISTGSGQDTITVSTPAESNIGQGSPDSISTGGGDDVIHFTDVIQSGGAATLDAGDGNDQIVLADDLYAQSIFGGSGNDTITTGSAADTIDAGDGDDVITCSDTAVYLGAPTRTIDGGEGNNRITVGAGADVINVGSGDDTITTGAGDDTIGSVGGSDSITTGDGNDQIDVNDDSGTAGTPHINSGGGNDLIRVHSGSANVIAGAGDDDVMTTGSNLPQRIDGGDGNDTINTGDGDDTIDAGAGNDWVNSAAGLDVVHGGDGNDFVQTAAGSQSLYGGAGNDTLIAGDGSDLLSGGGGKDKLAGQGGNDRLYGGNGNDQLSGGPGNDRIFGGAGNDKLFANTGINQLNGGDGNDVAFANSQRDALTEIESVNEL